MMDRGSSRLPYGEWPARNARMGDVALAWAVLAVKGMGGDHVVLIGDCPLGDYQGVHDCSVEAGGCLWSFRGSVIDEKTEQGRLRVWVHSDGPVTADPIEAQGT